MTENPAQLLPQDNETVSSHVCCELFIETLNKIRLGETIDKSDDSSSSNDTPTIEEKDTHPANPIENPLSPGDVLSFLSYCQIWQIK